MNKFNSAVSFTLFQILFECIQSQDSKLVSRIAKLEKESEVNTKTIKYLGQKNTNKT